MSNDEQSLNKKKKAVEAKNVKEIGYQTAEWKRKRKKNEQRVYCNYLGNTVRIKLKNDFVEQ